MESFVSADPLVLRVDLPTVLLFPFLIASLARNQGRMAQLMSMRGVYFLGVVSYSIYLIHGPFRPVELMIVRALHPQPLGFAMAIGFALAGSVSVIPFAWIAYRSFERPGRTIGRRLFAKHPTAPPLPAGMRAGAPETTLVP